MIEFHCETTFELENVSQYIDWISRILESENFRYSELNYIFCDDKYLHEMNLKYLKHDTLTDIITFPYNDGAKLKGDIFISIDRVRENAKTYGVVFEMELRRVIAHGVLHLMGYNDKTEMETKEMRSKENQKMKLFHVEQ